MKSHYQALIKTDVPNFNKGIWKLKAPLKLKVFLWYLRKGVILTKDNLAKRNWQGSTTCSFCSENETIRHLFFDCRFARVVWGLIYLTFSITKPFSVTSMFGAWLCGFHKRLTNIALLGAAITVWAIWLHRNDLVFKKKIISSPLQVIYTIAHWLRTWVVLQKVELQDTVVAASQSLLRVVTDYFTQARGWRSSLRIDCH